VTLKLEHPRLMVGLLCITVLALGAVVELDNRVLDKAFLAGVRAGMDYCAGQPIPEEF